MPTTRTTPSTTSGYSALTLGGTQRPPAVPATTNTTTAVNHVSLARGLGISESLYHELKHRQVNLGSTWVHAVVSLYAPSSWASYPVCLDEALEWMSTAQGRQRGWMLRFENGDRLGCVRRTNPNATAGVTLAAEARGQPTGAQMSFGDGQVRPGYVVVPNNTPNRQPVVLNSNDGSGSAVSRSSSSSSSSSNRT